MTNLDEVGQKWLELYEALDHLKPAGLFAAYAHPLYRAHGKRILYVGKATDGPFEQNSFASTKGMASAVRLGQVNDTSARIFRSKAGTQGASFWGFANDLSKQLDPSVGDLSNLVWSNIAKIGHQEDVPSGHLLSAQLALAEKTLIAEIEAFSPTIVVFVTRDFAQTVLRAAVDGQDHASWEKSSKRDEKGQLEDMWFMRPRSDRPAVLWMRHPQFSSRMLRQHAIEHVSELLA